MKLERNNIAVSVVQKLLIFLKRKLVHERQLRSRRRSVSEATSTAQVRQIAQDLGFTYFLDFDSKIGTKRREFKSAVNFFSIDLQGKSVLDIGPGTADSLDCAKSIGAAETMFVDAEPIFVKFAELKGHVGEDIDYRFEPYFPHNYQERFDFIYAKGSINCDWVNEQAKLIIEGNIKGFFDFDNWLKSVRQLAKPGAHIILMPAMARQEEKIVDQEYGLETYYWCPNLDEYKESYFVTTLIDNGYSSHEDVPGFTQKRSFPLAFHLKASN